MFRFAIRDLLWLMVVVACLLSWWRDRSQQDREISQWIYAVRQLSQVLKSDGWSIQGGIGGLTAEKGEQSVELVGFPVKPLLLPMTTLAPPRMK